ncbi:MAG: proton-conducting transporter membrane subunit, partial [Planctomycetota bacterium]
GVVVAERGTSELKRLGGLVTTHPVLSGLFLFSSLSLAGIPILSGFWAKLVLVKAGLEAGAFGIVAVSLVVSILTIFSMIKIWTNAFWGSPPEDAPEPSANWRQLGPIFGLAAITLAVSLGAPAVYKLAMRTGNDLLTPSIYIDAVLPPNLEAKLDEAEAKLTDDDGPAEDSDASSDQPQELMP